MKTKLACETSQLIENPYGDRKTILGIEIDLPKNDNEGIIYLEKLEELVNSIGFSDEEIKLIRSALAVAKIWGTKDNESYVPCVSSGKLDRTSWYRRSGRIAMTHFVESTVLALKSLDLENIDKKSILKIILITLLHDTVEDSKGLYDYKKLRADLRRFSKTKDKDFIKDVIEGVRRLTIESKNDTLLDVIKKLTPDVKFDKKLVGEINDLLNEYDEIHGIYKEGLKEIKGGMNINIYIVNYLKNTRKKEKKLLKEIKTKFEKLLSNMDFENITEMDAIVILSRLSETITALGPIDVDGFSKGDYAISNFDMKKYLYGPYFEKVGSSLNKKLGQGVNENLKKIRDKYLNFAKKYIEKRFKSHKVKYKAFMELQDLFQQEKK